MDTPKTPRISVTVVISAKNEERTIAEVVRSVQPFCDEILVMDGHSQDKTREIACQAGARVEVDPGRGKGSAIRASFDLAKGEFILLMDADGSHDPAEIPRLLEPLISDRADLCIGSRFLGGSEELSVTVGQLIRSVGNIAMNIAINKRFGQMLSDTLNGYRAIRASTARRLKLNEDIHTIEQEMVIKCLRAGFRVVNVPSHERARRYGESHIRIWREWPRFVWSLFKELFFGWK